MAVGWVVGGVGLERRRIYVLTKFMGYKKYRDRDN